MWSASGYVGAFTRAANVVYETPEGRKIWKLKPLQLLITLIGVLFAAVILAMLVLSGPVVDAIGQAIGVGDTGQTVWNVAKWPVVLIVLALMIAVLYYSTPNVKLRGFKWVSPGAARRHPGGDRRLGRLRVLRGELRQLQQDLRRAGRRGRSS